MFEGKMLRGLTGTPMRRMAFAKSSLAEAEPEPFTLANLTTKALTDAILLVMADLSVPSSSRRGGAKRRGGDFRAQTRNHPAGRWPAPLLK